MSTVPGNPPQYSTTDFEVLQTAQDRLLEPRSSTPPITIASTQWTPDEWIGFLDYRVKRFLRDTGIVVARLGYDGVGNDNSIGQIPGQESVDLPQNLIDVLRLAFVNYAPVPASGVGVAVNIQNSGDNQNFTIDQAPSPAANNQFFLNGLLQRPGIDYTLTGLNLALAAPIVGPFNLQGFINTGTPVTVTPVDSTHFTIPTAPNVAANFQLFLNGALLLPGGAAPADYSLAGLDITTNYALTGSFTLQAFINSGVPETPIDSGDHRNFILPDQPVPTTSLQTFLNGLLVRPGPTPADYTAGGTGITFNYTLTGTWTLQAFIGGMLQGASAIQDVPNEDFLSLDATQSEWETTTAPQPYGYTRSITQQLQAFLANPPSDVGAIDLTFVAFTGPLTGLGVKLGIPPEFCMYPLYGMMADAYSVEGEAYNPQMAQFCESKYSEGIMLAKCLLDAPSFMSGEEV